MGIHYHEENVYLDTSLSLTLNNQKVDRSQGLCLASYKSGEMEVNHLTSLFVFPSLSNASRNMIFIDLPPITSIIFMSNPSTYVGTTRVSLWGCLCRKFRWWCPLGLWSLSQLYCHGYLGRVYLPKCCNDANDSTFVMRGNMIVWLKRGLSSGKSVTSLTLCYVLLPHAPWDEILDVLFGDSTVIGLLSIRLMLATIALDISPHRLYTLSWLCSLRKVVLWHLDWDGSYFPVYGGVEVQDMPRELAHFRSWELEVVGGLTISSSGQW